MFKLIGHLSSKSGLLDASEGGLNAADEAIVDADHARLHLLRDPPALP